MSAVAVGFESYFQKALERIMDKEVRILGILGMGGIGKTTLMKRIYCELARTKEFDILIWVTVSKDLSLEKIQDDIWKVIGSFYAKWTEKTFHEKAEDIRNVLCQKKFLLFLDDIWKKVDLIELGIPYEEKQKEFKVILSTREQHVCGRMNAQSVILVGPLSEDSAWCLFKEKTGEDILRGPRIENFAINFSQICNGLPILLCTVAAAMARRKTLEEWLYAWRELTEFYLDGLGEGHVFSLLEFCFHSLPNIRAQSCLLYFGLFSEDFNILKNDLIDFWISEDFFGYSVPLNETLYFGYDIIDTLIKASLLEEEDNSVKMQDVVRDFCLWKVSKSTILKTAQLMEVKIHKNLERVGRISSVKHSIKVHAQDSSNLLTFFLNHNPFIMIKGRFLPFMGGITVLDLSNSGVEEVPQGISTLVSLQHLNLSHNWFERLPIELKMLAKLKCLNLEHNDLLRVIPKQVITGLSSLLVLRMFRCGFSLQEEEDNILCVEDMDIEPLNCLEHLKVLSLSITCASALQEFFNSHRLPRCTQALSLEVFWGSKSVDISLLAGMKDLRVLEVHSTENLENLFVNFMMDYGCLHDSELLTERNFSSLQEVYVGKCSSLKELTWIILAPNLAVLRVIDCGELEEIISLGQLGEIQSWDENMNPFAKLEVLALENLPKLKCIFWKALPFQFLKKIKVFDCPLLKKLPLNSHSSNGNALLIEAEEGWWTNAECEDDDTKTTFLMQRSCGTTMPSCMLRPLNPIGR